MPKLEVSPPESHATLTPAARGGRAVRSVASASRKKVGTDTIAGTKPLRKRTGKRPALWKTVLLGVLAATGVDGAGSRAAHGAFPKLGGGTGPGRKPLQFGTPRYDGSIAVMPEVGGAYDAAKAYLNHANVDAEFTALTNATGSFGRPALTVSGTSAGTAFDVDRGTLLWNPNATTNVQHFDAAGNVQCAQQSPAMSLLRAIKSTYLFVSTAPGKAYAALPDINFGNQFAARAENLTNARAEALGEPRKDFAASLPSLKPTTNVTAAGMPCDAIPPTYAGHLNLTSGTTADASTTLANVATARATLESRNAQNLQYALRAPVTPDAALLADAVHFARKYEAPAANLTAAAGNANDTMTQLALHQAAKNLTAAVGADGDVLAARYPGRPTYT